MVAIVRSRATPTSSSSSSILFFLLMAFMSFRTKEGALLAAIAGNPLKHALALRPPAASCCSWGSRGRIASTTTPTDGRSKSHEVMAGATEAESSTTSRAIFLDNHGGWVSCDTAGDACSSTGNNSSSKLHLENLSLQQLRKQAQQQGQTSAGPKKELVGRLLRQEPPGNKGGGISYHWSPKIPHSLSC